MSTYRLRKARATAFFVVASFIGSQLCFGLLPSVFEPWNALTVDKLFVLRSSMDSFRPAYDDTIVHVDLNNSTIQELNNFYLNRSHYARVIANLAKMDTAVQAYDVIFAARVNDADDRLLVDSTSHAGNVYFGMAFALSEDEFPGAGRPLAPEILRYLRDTKWRVSADGDVSDFYTGRFPLLTFPALASASVGLGFLSIINDGDGVIRRVPLLVRYEDGFYPSLPFRVICDYLGVTPDRIHISKANCIILRGARRPGGEPHDIAVPVDSRGAMVINFIGPWERMKHYSFADVYGASDSSEDLEIWGEELTGKIVLVSDVSTGATDIGPVPADPNFPLSGLHANVMHTILTEEFFREIKGPAMLLIESALMCLVLFFSLRFSSVSFSFGTAALALGYLGTAIFLFLYGRVMLHIIRPIMFIFVAVLIVLAYRYFNEEKEKEAYRKTLEARFPPRVVEKIMADRESISARSEKKELTILFSDIKSFTTYSASLTPDQIRRYLNEYFEAMVDIVFDLDGTVDKYIGDGLMVFFGDPTPQADHALRCVRAAIDMQKRTRELKEKWLSEGGFPLQIRIGVNTGEVVVGDMGSRRGLSYTVLGAPVNMAQRLESNAPVEGILISERTRELVKDYVRTKPLGKIKVKGIDTPVEVFEVPVDQDDRNWGAEGFDVEQADRETPTSLGRKP